MKKEKVSPCTRCQRMQDPGKCDNKDCKAWRDWFLQSWEQTRQLYLKKDSKPDPCDGCVCPRALCFNPCQAKREWEESQ